MNRACSDSHYILNLKRTGTFLSTIPIPTEPKSIVARYTISKDNPSKVDPESAKTIMEIDQPFQNHNGGVIEFGPDGVPLHRIG